MVDRKTPVRYRILGGSKHGQFVELPVSQRKIKFPISKPLNLNSSDDLIPYRVEEYEVSRFLFAAAGLMVNVLVPVGSSNAVIEGYFVRLVTEG